jgi:hypothetical protein
MADFATVTEFRATFSQPPNKQNVATDRKLTIWGFD